MSSSLRALMRREKAARRTSDTTESSLPSKLQARAATSEDDKPVFDSQPITHVPPSDPSPKIDTPDSQAEVLEEIFEIVSDPEDLEQDKYLPPRKSQRTGNSLFTSSLSDASRDPYEDFHSSTEEHSTRSRTSQNQRYGSATTAAIDALGDGDHGPNSNRHLSVTQNQDSSANSLDPVMVPDAELANDIHVYDQLNTAFSSRIDYERERILSNVEQSGDTVDYGAVGGAGSTITSSNFGKSTFRLTADANLPEGFFDNKRADAQIRGKMTRREAGEKLSELDRSQAELLNEAQYIQDKYVESWRERLRLEHDEHEHEEVVRELSAKVAAIKGELQNGTTLDSATEIDMSREQPSPQATSLSGFEDLDDFSWRSKALI
ncbi:plasmid maintenance toxin, putative [Babesia ovis]|uniref:Plasmid maintenance toxin, putative n=1 Tax=Babesia ovis TaxID=5869 RepID=A0A9W5T9D5_BABOV|nr:plasmid maintenance toxin, putative [Babesia ovis]